jgi:hypothetical protein
VNPTDMARAWRGAAGAPAMPRSISAGAGRPVVLGSYRRPDALLSDLGSTGCEEVEIRNSFRKLIRHELLAYDNARTEAPQDLRTMTLSKITPSGFIHLRSHTSSNISGRLECALQ